jgi:methionine-gamma-lyase
LTEGQRNFGTRAVHPPSPKPQPGRPVSTPVDLSTAYGFDDPEELAHATEAHTGSGYVYSRIANPTTDAFEAAIADLEGAQQAEAFSSGMAAIATVLLALCRPGSKVVTARQIFGTTHSLLSTRLRSFGVENVFADVDDFDAIESSLQGATLLYCETIGNPRLQVADLESMGRLAEGAGIPLVVDNTFATPVLSRPLEHGAAIVVHSATKYIGGHHDLIGGVASGSAEHLEPVVELAAETGPTLSPFNAWLALRGLQTLELRVTRSCASALAIAAAVQDHPAIASVHYPALEGDPYHARAQRFLGGSGGGVVGVELEGGADAAGRFQQALEIVTPGASLGGTHSLVAHAAKITHTQLSDDELDAVGIGPGYCRLSVGIEDEEDLIDDIGRALDAI